MLITIIVHYCTFENYLLTLRKLILKDMAQYTINGKTLLTTKDLQDLFNVCRSTIINWERASHLLPYKVGRKKYYRAEDLRDYIENRNKKPF